MPSLRLPLVPGWNPIRVSCVPTKKSKRKTKEKTMDPMHEAKVDELIKNMTKALKDTCQRLYQSGGIDVESYDPEEFILAKILVSAAMEQCKGNLRPLSDDFNKDFKNLLHF